MKPNYKIQIKEAVQKVEKKNPGTTFVRYFVFLFLIGLVAYSVFVDKEVFTKMDIYYKAFLALALVWAVLAGSVKKEMIESDVELRFYDEYFEIYRNRRLYQSGKEKRTLDTFKYSDLTSVVYDQGHTRLIFQGTLEDVIWEYKNGKVSKEETSHQVIKDGFDVIDTSFIKDINIIQEIEEHSPIQIKVNREIDLGLNKIIKKK